VAYFSPVPSFRNKEGRRKKSVDLKPRTEAGDSVAVTSNDVRRHTAS